MKCGLSPNTFFYKFNGRGFSILKKVQEESGFKLKPALFVSQHSRDWKSSSIHFRRGKAQSLIFQLDLFIKTQQIFYIPRCGQRPPAGRPLPSSDPPWRAETGALVTNSQCEFLKKRTRSIAVTTDCPLSQSLIVQSTPRGETEKCKKTSVDPVYPRPTLFPRSVLS